MNREDLTTIAGNAFIVTDRLGDIAHTTDRGLFVADTRFLSRYALRLNGNIPVELESGTVGFGEAQIYSTNPTFDSIPAQTLTLSRRRRLGGGFREEIELANHGPQPVDFDLTLAIDADFADIFEVRTFLSDEPAQRGSGQVQDGQIIYSTRSVQHRRRTMVDFSRKPTSIAPDQVTFGLHLPPDSAWGLEVTITWELPQHSSTHPVPVWKKMSREEESLAVWLHDAPVLETDDRTLQLAYARSLHDLVMLELTLSSGQAILAAGVPWYMAIFGRDATFQSTDAAGGAPFRDRYPANVGRVPGQPVDRIP